MARVGSTRAWLGDGLVAALSFDDGPSQWTAPILDLLDEHDVHATFFVVGMRVAACDPKILVRMLDYGHEIGNHTWNHPHLPALSDIEVRMELQSTGEAIAAMCQWYPPIWRAPYLDLTEREMRLAEQYGLTHVGCDVIPGDWALTDPQQIAQNVLSDLKDGDIVLLHDGIPPAGGSGTADRQPTVDAVALLLDTPNVSWCRVSDL